MKVLLLNGSCRANGCTNAALSKIAEVLNAEGVETEIFQIGAQPIRDCIGCGQCAKLGKCVFSDDAVNEFVEKARTSDAFVFGSPVYYAHPDGRILCFLDRAFYSGKSAFRHKPAAVVASARRAGTTASLDVLAKYPTISEMPLVSSTYWNMVHGSNAQQVTLDAEGIQTMENVAHNLAWILKCIEAGKEKGIVAPNTSAAIKTNFVR